jgi:integrase
MPKKSPAGREVDRTIALGMHRVSRWTLLYTPRRAAEILSRVRPRAISGHDGAGPTRRAYVRARARAPSNLVGHWPGTPHFSPHGLRRRRGSLHYKRTGSLADVAELLGDSKRVAAEHYVYALTDYREVDRTIALARVQNR